MERHANLLSLPIPVRMKLRFKKRRVIVASGILCLCAMLGILICIPAAPLESIRTWPSSPVLLDRCGTLRHARLSSAGEWNIPIPLEQMGAWLPLVAVTVEDKRFWSHPGMDILALGRALWSNLRRGKIVSGASTITSQVIRISTPNPRTPATKIVEFVQAMRLERHLSKREILEIYLNRAPFGGPVRGVEAASLLYFGKHAMDLSLGESALLIGMLRGPTMYRPDRNPGAAKKRRDSIIRLMRKRHAVRADIADLALLEPLPKSPGRMPFHAWHYADMAFKRLPSSGGVVQSPLDSELQNQVEHILRQALALGAPGLTAAAAVMDAHTGALLAYVGNARLDVKKGRSWVDCGQAPRSPGSTLKPFAYLLAFEKGKLIPASLLADSPLNFAGNAPRNFDRRYRGPVSAGVALADSLNAPAVRVARMVGHNSLLVFLRQCGFASLHADSAHYGDSLILGGAEVTLLQLVEAYGALASLGERRAPCVDAALLPVRGTRIFRKDASYLIAEILKDPGRLSDLDRFAFAGAHRTVAFKTGTSYGFRDAWTIAYTPDYVVGAWFGHEDGSPDPALVGVNMAVPPVMRIFRALARTTLQTQKHSAGKWYETPATITYKRVCGLSGRTPGPACPSTHTVPVLPDVWRTTQCALHAYRRGTPVVLWPPELENWHEGRTAEKDPSVRAIIVSPVAGTHYLLTPGASRQRIALRSEGTTLPVHWYADDAYIGAQKTAEPLFWDLTPGEHTLSLLDADGRSAKTRIAVTDLGAALKAKPN